MKAKRVILDTNLWISFLISKNFNEIDGLILDGSIKLIFSDELIEEFLSVVKRPAIRKYFSDADLDKLLQLFDAFGKFVKVSTKVSLCRDPKDDFLLNLAIDSNADHLVTGDADLLIIKEIKGTKIVSWKDFIREIKNQQ